PGFDRPEGRTRLQDELEVLRFDWLIAWQAIVGRREFPQSRGELGFQCLAAVSPFPIAAQRSGPVHTGFARQTEHILEWDEHRVGDRCLQGANEIPVNLTAV